MTQVSKLVLKYCEFVTIPKKKHIYFCLIFRYTIDMKLYTTVSNMYNVFISFEMLEGKKTLET